MPKILKKYRIVVFYTISINFSIITGCLEMKRGTAQSNRMCYKKRHYQLEMVLFDTRLM